MSGVVGSTTTSGGPRSQLVAPSWPVLTNKSVRAQGSCYPFKHQISTRIFKETFLLSQENSRFFNIFRFSCWTYSMASSRIGYSNGELPRPFLLFSHTLQCQNVFTHIVKKRPLASPTPLPLKDTAEMVWEPSPPLQVIWLKGFKLISANFVFSIA